MFRRIVDSLAYLFSRFTGRGTRSIEAKLDNIEKRLDRIEEKIERQRKFAIVAFLSAPGLGITAIGVALLPRAEDATSAVVLIALGVGLPIAAGLGYIIRTLRR